MARQQFLTWLWWVIALSIVIAFRLSGFDGSEWHTFRKATYQGFLGIPIVANPSYIVLFLYPLALLSFEIGSTFLRLVSIYSLHLIARLTGVNRWLLLISFPVCWLLWFNQLDGLVALGVALGYVAIKHDRPLLQGAATLLLCIKPHIGAPLALYYLWRQRHYQAFIISSIVLTVSFVWLGFWPVQYMKELIGQINNGYIISNFSSENISLYPWGLLLWPVVLIPVSLDKKVVVILIVTMLSSPYMPSYSLLSLMAMPLPIWSYVLISTRFIMLEGELLKLTLPLLLALNIALFLFRNSCYSKFIIL